MLYVASHSERDVTVRDSKTGGVTPAYTGFLFRCSPEPLLGSYTAAQPSNGNAKSGHMRFVHSRCYPGFFLGGYVLDRYRDLRGIIEM